MSEPAEQGGNNEVLDLREGPAPRLSRSPRPYYRRKSDAAEADEFEPREGGEETSWSSNASSDVESDRRRTSRYRTSVVKPHYLSSGNVSESEPEVSHGLKALPAPTFRPRKGLKASEGVDGESPTLLTPSLIEEENHRIAEQYFSVNAQKQELKSPDFDAARKRVEQKRNAEFLRRSTETAFLVFVGTATLWSTYLNDSNLIGLQSSFLSCLCVYIVLVGVYPIRLILLPYLRDRNFRFGHIRVPANYDPATLLYPVFIPALVAASLGLDNANLTVLNLVLGISSLPARLLPDYGGSFGTYNFQWLLSTIPITTFEYPFLLPWNSALWWLRKPNTVHLDRVSPETLAIIFPLHQALLKPINSLTTSSLLPSESHLLSASLINLMLFSDSPQSNILNILIWTGGTGLLILCTAALERNVALERVPNFLFGTSKGSTRSNVKRVLKTLQDGIPLSNSREKSHKLPDGRRKQTGLHRRAFTLAEDHTETGIGEVTGLKSDNEFIPERARRTSDGSEQSPAIQRTHTFSADKGFEHRSRVGLKTRSNSSFAIPFLEPFASLSKNEAELWKWGYSAYCFAIIIGLILGPVRMLIGRYALNNQEPFGWALSYLFGDIPQVQQLVKEQLLTDWVQLPRAHCVGIRVDGLAQNLRCHYGEGNVRIALFFYWAAVILAGLAAVLILGVVAEVDTRRKVFHGMMVGMLLPTAYIDPAFLSLGLGLVLAVFLLLDMIRAGQLRPLSKPIAHFLAPYVDGRDLCGPVIVSHIFLLIGCAIPFWLSLAGIERKGEYPWQGWELESRDASMVTGVICVGMGDAAASLIGRRFGRHKWPWAGGKSLEGSAAFAFAVTMGLVAARLWLWLGGWQPTYDSHHSWITILVKCIVAASGASFTEAVLTGCNDNVVVPVVLWLLVRAFRI